MLSPASRAVAYLSVLIVQVHVISCTVIPANVIIVASSVDPQLLL